MICLDEKVQQLWKTKGCRQWKRWSEGLHKRKQSLKHYSKRARKGSLKIPQFNLLLPVHNLKNLPLILHLEKAIFLSWVRIANKRLTEPAYLKLSYPVDGNLLKAVVEVSDRKGTLIRFYMNFSNMAIQLRSKSLKIENTIFDNFV